MLTNTILFKGSIARAVPLSVIDSSHKKTMLGIQFGIPISIGEIKI